jgi:hypothetical protein
MFYPMTREGLLTRSILYIFAAEDVSLNRFFVSVSLK